MREWRRRNRSLNLGTPRPLKLFLVLLDLTSRQWERKYLGRKAIVYPPWAPPVLVQIHQELLAELAQLSAADSAALAKLRIRVKNNVGFLTVQERLKLTEALILNQNMKGVWASLDRRRSEFERLLPKALKDASPPIPLEGTLQKKAFIAEIQAKRDAAEAILRSPAAQLLGACEHVYLTFGFLPKIDTSSMKDHFRQIAKHSEALANLLPSAHWHSVQRYMDVMESLYFLESKSVSNIESMADMLRLKADSVFQKFFAKSPGEFFPRATDPWSNLPGFLKRLSELARKLEKSPPKMMTQPNSPNAKLRYFQLELSRYFVRAYGQPLHKQVADIASAVFSVSISAENVRKLINYRERNADPEKTTD